MNNNNKNNNNAKFLYAISFAWQLGFFIIIPLVLCVLIGFWLDNKFQTSPFCLLGSIVIALFFTIYDTYKILLPLLNNKKNNVKH